MDFAATGFDWNYGNRDKCQSHGVSIVEIETIFRGSIALFPDLQHSKAEERFKAVGRSAAGRHILVAFTLRRRGSAVPIRPISARYMHGKEIKHYEKQKNEIEEASRSKDR
jgi:uncharacterized DUF497 family protein